MALLSRYSTKSLLVAGWLALLAAAAGATDLSPVGLWRTIDDDTGRPAGLIEITQSGDRLEGRIVNIIPQSGDAIDSACRNCGGALKGERIVGMTILKGFRRDGDVWDGGTITDPRSGFVYDCELRVGDGGKKLFLRGYLGIRLLGRTTIWERAE